MNPYLPLLRYRTGDTAQMTWVGDQPLLDRFSGRPIVMLRSANGTAVSSFDVTQLFEELPLRRWTVHQRADSSIVVSIEPETGTSGALEDLIAAAARTALGSVDVIVEPLKASDKVIPFTTEEPSK
jgi:phenylacetate-CoA ligase